MRKGILFSYVFLLTSVAIQAQSEDEDNIRGIRGGWQSSDLFYDNKEVGSTPLNAFYAGFFNENKIIPMLYIGSGFEYFQNGSVISSNDTTYKQHLLSVPVYLKFKIGPVYAVGGASANFKVAEKYLFGDNKFDVPDALKANWFDIPVHLGLGVQILMFRVEAKYYWGTFDMYDNSSAKMQYFQLGAAVAF